MKKRLAILLLAVLFVGSELQAQDTAKPALRTWKDSTGQFSIQATFVRIVGDNVVLQGINKKEISLPLTNLSATDQQYVKARLTPIGIGKKTITNTIGIKLNKIPPGTFMMGSPESEPDRSENEQQHKVRISKAFYMQTTEVTQGQWKEVMGTEPWKDKSYVKEGPNYPATWVSWDDAVAFCKKLSANEGKTYRLPTEAEWEYACRAGSQTTWSFGNDEKLLDDFAWYQQNAYLAGERYAHQVGLKKSNAFGLYDMHGNVWEWCYDYYGDDYYKNSRKKDPMGPTAGSFRILRGGSWDYYSRDSRSAFRSRDVADSRSDVLDGFRMVRELDFTGIAAVVSAALTKSDREKTLALFEQKRVTSLEETKAETIGQEIARGLEIGGGPFMVEKDEYGEITSAAFVGANRISTVLGASKGQEIARTRAVLKAKGQFVKWLKEDVTVVESAEDETIFVLEGAEALNGNNWFSVAGKSIEPTTSKFSTFANGILRGLKTIAIDVIVDENTGDKKLRVMLYWSKEGSDAVKKLKMDLDNDEVVGGGTSGSETRKLNKTVKPKRVIVIP